MADSQEFKTAERHLTQALESDQKVVTFRDVARELGCHVHLAKNLLLHYLSTHPDVIPTYLLSGPLLATSALAQTTLTRAASPSATQSLAHLSATQKIRVVHMDEMSEDEWNSEAEEEEEQNEEDFEALAGAEESIKVDGDDALDDVVPRWGVVMVNQDGLEDKKKLFSGDQLSVHIYSLAPAPLKDPALYLAASASLRTHSSYIDASTYGTISGVSLVATGPKRMRDGGLDLIAKKAEVKAQVKPEAKDVKKDAKESKKEAKQGFFSRKESPTEKEAKEVQAKPPQPRTTKNKRRIITSDDEDEPEVSSSTSKSPPKPAQSTKPSLEPTSSMVRAEDQAAMEAMMTMDVDDFDDFEVISAPKPTAASSSVPKPKGTARKRRQVKKSKVEMDDKGYMVTKDYFTDESYSGSDTDTEPVSKATKSSSSSSKVKKETPAAPARASAPAKPAAPARPPPARSTGPKKAAPLGQSSLAGFFKKKDK
ncbi:hypothetical protein Q8F55_008842 [Vanrija albida]|uniref:DNA polymerase delta subunit 3 n=1 Tax=Vanrija albida TaxID=181172 RepID=A0ABR3PSW5_9TREE